MKIEIYPDTLDLIIEKLRECADRIDATDPAEAGILDRLADALESAPKS